MTYTQITLHERYAIWMLRKLGFTPASIARQLKRHRSTITREIRRNIWRENGVTYQPLKAQSYTNERRHAVAAPARGDKEIPQALRGVRQSRAAGGEATHL